MATGRDTGISRPFRQLFAQGEFTLSDDMQQWDRSADILVRLDPVGKLQADKNVRAPIT